jgi:hypothetical protein
MPERQRLAAGDGVPLDWRGPLRPAEKACCCPATPLFRVVLPPRGDRPHPTDLLLCGHHFRVSRTALATAGATVYDADGSLLGNA